MTISEITIICPKKQNKGMFYITFLLSLLAIFSLSLSETIAVQVLSKDIIDPDAIDDFINDVEKDIPSKNGKGTKKESSKEEGKQSDQAQVSIEEQGMDKDNEDEKEEDAVKIQEKTDNVGEQKEISKE